MVESLPGILRTPSGKVELAPDVFVDDLARLEGAIADFEDRGLVLVGRRHLRSNNSWMHNINVLVKGAPRCTLQVHPDDAVALGLTDGAPASITSRVGSVTAPVEVTDSIRPGVVSLPHGWGHDKPGTRMRVAAEHAGVNSNVLSDDQAMDPLSGTSVLNGIPVDVSPPHHPRPPEPVDPRLRRVFALQSTRTVTQTWIWRCRRRLGVVHTVFTLATGNSQGCTPFAPQGDVS